MANGLRGAADSRAVERISVQKVSRRGLYTEEEDLVAVEEPLQIRLNYHSGGAHRRKTLSITMRTPGDDEELVAGFLFTEGIIQSAGDVERISAEGNVAEAELTTDAEVDPSAFERNFYMHSGCGVCGRASIESLAGLLQHRRLKEGYRRFRADVISRLPMTLREAQSVFGFTGGLHAAALFDSEGNLLAIREDVGRHNAVDKLVGSLLLKGEIPLPDRLVMVSGRASFELAHKAIAAGFLALAAVGAPSSLAVEAAREFNLTLLGFVRDGRFNIYCGSERITESGEGNIAAL
ncbi:MAG: formate dehydrogenase accessory sulfurtransferase FdhD [Deltaproteobacteria bacterium]